jgi:hypothetical protein
MDIRKIKHHEKAFRSWIIVRLDTPTRPMYLKENLEWSVYPNFLSDADATKLWKTMCAMYDLKA